MASVGAWVVIVLSFASFSKATAIDTLENVEWKYSRTLYDYKIYSSITLERVYLPPHTLSVNLTLNARCDVDSCETRKVNLYSNQYGIPVVSRDKEAFPKNSYTPNTVPNITISTNNKTHQWVMSDFHEGYLFIMAIMPHSDTRIRQKGLYQECEYLLSMRAVVTYYAEESIPLLPNNETKSFVVAGQTQKLIGLKVPLDTKSYQVKIDGCETKPCDVRISLWQTLNPRMQNDTAHEVCSVPCNIEEIHPYTESFAYVAVSLLSPKDESISVTLTLNSCTQNRANDTGDLKSDCVLPLGRVTPMSSDEDSDFQDRFVIWDGKDAKPSRIVSVKAPEDSFSVMRFKLRAGDTGASLNVKLARPAKPTSKSNQNIELMLCASLSKVVPAKNCSDGAAIRIDSKHQKKKKSVMIPYPQAGVWYMSIQSRCYNGSSNDSVECVETPVANVTIGMSACVNGGCGRFGSCKIYVSAGILFTACDCASGWRGYGCNDGSKAESLTAQKVAVYLLTLSNLAFIPGICLSLYRRYFVEAFVYSFNMFVSTFYHACDSSVIYKLCILKYGTLIFSDFFASLMSFAVTLLAMARIPLRLRSFLHMVAAMFVAVFEVHNRHGLFEQLMPIASGLAIVAISWGYEMYKRKSLFPSKKRYLFFIVPGLAFAVVGLSLNLAVETDQNYKYVHSAWHVFVASSIVFLLPPKRTKTQEIQEQPLSVQSGDVTRSNQGLIANDDGQPSFQNAGNPNPSPPPTERTALNNGGSFVMANRVGSSYIL